MRCIAHCSCRNEHACYQSAPTHSMQTECMSGTTELGRHHFRPVVQNQNTLYSLHANRMHVRKPASHQHPPPMSQYVSTTTTDSPSPPCSAGRLSSLATSRSSDVFPTPLHPSSSKPLCGCTSPSGLKLGVLVFGQLGFRVEALMVLKMSASSNAAPGTCRPIL
jgi:hypothetical protein